MLCPREPRSMTPSGLFATSTPHSDLTQPATRLTLKPNKYPFFPEMSRKMRMATQPMPHVLPPANNPAFTEPEHATMNYDEMENAVPAPRRLDEGGHVEGGLPQSTVRQTVPPINNPAFNLEHATMSHDEMGNVVSPRAPQHDTVRFVRDQYAALGPHSTYNSVDTEA